MQYDVTITFGSVIRTIITTSDRNQMLSAVKRVKNSGMLSKGTLNVGEFLIN